MNIHLTSLGCRLNEAELELWAGELAVAGHLIVDSAEKADAIVVNTCAVTNEAVRKSRQTINRLHRLNPTALLAATGCSVTLSSPAQLESLGLDLAVSNHDKQLLVRRLGALLQTPDRAPAAARADAGGLFARNRQRAFVKIQDGCRYQCTYCIVTRARGDEISRPLEDIVNETNALHQQGVHEIVLTGVHVGGYGSDTGSDLARLVDRLLGETDIPRVRFASVEPWDLPDSLLALFSNPRLMPHMHLPVQSGSDSVLRRMARRTRAAHFKQLVAELRAGYPGFNVTTDLIVGFPGETEDEWQQTLDFVDEVRFGNIHIFNFSAREGTRAAALPDQIDPATRRRRSRTLQLRNHHWQQVFLDSQIGSRVEVLWESTRDDPAGGCRHTGYTPNYCRISVSGATGSLENTITQCRVDTRLDTATLSTAAPGEALHPNRFRPGGSKGTLQAVSARSDGTSGPDSAPGTVPQGRYIPIVPVTANDK